MLMNRKGEPCIHVGCSHSIAPTMVRRKISPCVEFAYTKSLPLIFTTIGVRQLRLPERVCRQVTCACLADGGLGVLGGAALRPLPKCRSPAQSATRV